MDPGRDPSAGFFRLIVIGILLTSGVLSDPAPIYKDINFCVRINLSDKFEMK